ncbi:MAG: DNA polymerase Y family protein, partial [Rhodoplanes sp.]
IPSRYLSIWLRRLATDRLTRRRVSAPDDGEHAPLVVAHMVKSALRIAAMNDAAARLGLTVGTALADARARHPALEVAPSDPAADRGLLDAIADWCDRYTPLVGIDAPAGIMLDVAGCTHLFGGEAALARDIVTRLAAQGLRARVGIADTPGCAWAVARYGAWADMPVIRGEPKGRSLTSKLAGADSPSPLPRGERSRAQRAGEGGRTSTDGFEPPHPAPSASTSPRRGEVKEATSAGSMYSARAPASRNDEDRHVVILPPGGMREALAPLPLAALRLEPETVAALADVGLNRIADVLDLPRATLAARFDVSFLRRLDQALGREDEPITPKRPAPSYMAEQHFAEPIARERDVLGTIARLSIRLGYAMEARGEGARLVELALFRTDGKVHRLAVGAGAPVHEANRISRLFADRLAGLGEACDPGFGYDLVRLSAPVTERCAPVQTAFEHFPAKWEPVRRRKCDQQRITRANSDSTGTEFALAADRGAADHAGELGHLIDRLGARFGLRRVTRLAPQDTHIPEFAVAAVPAHAHLACAAPRLRGAAEVQAKAVPERDAIEPATQDTLAPARPARLFARPERIEAIAEVPDGPPVRFRWRRVLHEVMAAEGPERIALEWWRDAEGSALTRDYFRIETRAGMRVWLYREGLYGRETDAPRWFLHGLFG